MSLRFSLPSPLSSLSAQQDIQRGRDMVDSLPEIAALWIDAANGNAVLTSRQYPTPRVNASDRSFFKAHLNGTDFHVGERGEALSGYRPNLSCHQCWYSPLGTAFRSSLNVRWAPCLNATMIAWNARVF